MFLVVACITAVISLVVGDSAQSLGDAQISDNFGELAAACILASALRTRASPSS